MRGDFIQLAMQLDILTQPSVCTVPAVTYHNLLQSDERPLNSSYFFLSFTGFR
jgi:hypothetical protein